MMSPESVGVKLAVAWGRGQSRSPMPDVATAWTIFDTEIPVAGFVYLDYRK